MAPTAPSTAADTATRLLDAAEKVIARVGYDAATIREIASRAKVNSALIQYHFGGKAALYEAVIERRFKQGREVLGGAIAMVEATAGVALTREVLHLALRSVLLAFVRLVRENPDFHRIMQREQAAGLPVAKKVIARLTPLDPIASLIERAQREGLVRNDLPAFLIASVIFGAHQHCIVACPVLSEKLGTTPDDPEVMPRILDMNLRFFFEGLWPRESR